MITRGDSVYWNIVLTDPAGGPFNLTDCTVWVTYKGNDSLADADAIMTHWIEISAAGAVVASDGMKLGPGGVAAGIILERVDPAESTNFPVGQCVYDVQVKMPSTWGPGIYDIWTPIVNETDQIRADVTRATDTTI